MDATQESECLGQLANRIIRISSIMRHNTNLLDFIGNLEKKAADENLGINIPEITRNCFLYYIDVKDMKKEAYCFEIPTGGNDYHSMIKSVKGLVLSKYHEYQR